ncbi:hypothetical protein [Streptomyces aureoverticillatus]|uniref:hypothetical protein n=1 Tax=Streptomyces aureoverticillatus TaxID=66871 RepID=UPI0013DBD077|nr:hypothetical protein [Streptomyces aureoverticillatus]QIB45370.1 hypothetical protein G3H79_22165 [Streptomyces aureoverticillatus]
MHHHGYLWTGPKQRFDDEALRRPAPPHPPPDSSSPELIQRHREVRAEFPVVDLPPLETAYWLIKPEKLIRGTWDEPKGAAAWFGERLAEYAPRFGSEAEREGRRLAGLVGSAAARLGWGGDVSHGCYLERPLFLSLALVCCSPNRSMPEVACPARALSARVRPAATPP